MNISWEANYSEFEKQNIFILLSIYQLHLYFVANKSMRIISFRNTADTSLLIYTENAGKMNIPWGGIYSKLENKT